VVARRCVLENGF